MRLVTVSSGFAGPGGFNRGRRTGRQAFFDGGGPPPRDPNRNPNRRGHQVGRPSAPPGAPPDPLDEQELPIVEVAPLNDERVPRPKRNRRGRRRGRRPDSETGAAPLNEGNGAPTADAGASE